MGLEVDNNTIGKFKRSLPVKIQKASKDPPLIGINIRYLLDAVSGFRDSSLFLHLNSDDKQVQITGQESDKLAIIMPVRLDKS